MRGLFDRIVRPQSVAIVGISSKPGTMSRALLRNLQLNAFAGPIHLVGRSGGEIDGLPVHADARGLPEGIDLAILAVPAAGVGDAIEACVERKAGAAVVFASGFAELGEQGRDEQARIGELARAGALAVIGPNCIGYTNYRDGLPIAFANVAAVPRLPPETRDAVAIVAQSGGLAGHLRFGLEARGVPISYTISTGNEMGLGLAEFAAFLVADDATRVVTIFAETIRAPQAFLAAAREARAAGKVIVMMHTGRSARAQQAAQSHTGALAGDYAVMRTQVERAGVVLVESLDELLDVSEILARYPAPSPGGLGVLTLSGAFCGVAFDVCEELDVTLPPLGAASVAALRPLLPDYTTPNNPLDLGTQPLWQPELLRDGVQALLADPAIGGVALSIPGGASYATTFVENVIAGAAGSTKPLSVAIHGDAMPLPDDAVEAMRAAKLVLSRSSDRTLRAMSAIVRWANRPRTDAAPADDREALPPLGGGALPEWRAKQVLAAAGIAVPAGRLAHSADDAVAIAAEIGFPVAMKAQAAALAHKTEAGGVLLGIGHAAGVREGWTRLHQRIARAQPGLRLDGVLVEAMARPGVELVAGARRDPQWGPVLLIGLGGILVEALDDVRVIAADASAAEVRAELERLKSKRLLHGFRTLPAVDVDAVAAAVVALGALVRSRPEIVEVDVNPLVAHERGAGATALDALIVTA